MAVGYRSSSASGSSDAFGTSVTVPVPSGAAANDIALLAIEQWESGNPTVTWPTGFTEIINLASGSQKLKVAWKRLSGSDTGNYVPTWTGSQWAMGHCVLITGGITSGDPIEATNTASGTGTTVPSTSLSTATQPFLGHFVANENACTTTPPTSYTEVQDGDYLHSNYRIPGTTGTHTASGGTLSTSTLALVALIAVKPAGSGTTFALSQATESDSAFGIAAVKSTTLGQATETDSALGTAFTKTVILGLPAETDAANALSAVKSGALGLGSETDSAQALVATKVIILSLATETDTALALSSTSGVVFVLDLATETDSVPGELSFLIVQPSVTRVKFPTYQVALGHGRLLGRYLIDHPFSLLKIDGEWQAIQSPYQDQIASAEKYYQGGREILLTEAEAADLPPEWVETT